MGKIKVYARVKPSESKNDLLSSTSNKITIDKKFANRDRERQNAQVQYLFDFDLVFDQFVTQNEIFNSIAIDALDRFLEGFNATIFAYGQTGSGKTFTIEGSARRFDDRGLIPRSINYIYEKLKDRPDQDVSVHISYFEIYNEIGYDLLNPASRLESLLYTNLPRISIRERGNGQFVTHNLTSHLAADEDIAQHLLFQGSMSRKVASTSMNMQSSRSHAVFTIMLTSKIINSDTLTISKLNFVDLAGSERVAKTGAKGKVLNEAKFINLSLHHLEHVIIQLQKAARAEESPKKMVRSSTAPELHKPHPGREVKEAWSPTKSTVRKKHIPYRNSLLTMFLRDSLGGNCYTFMIAAVSFDMCHIDESISTCRFAQRVSCIKNLATRNEILDDKALIKKLRLHIRDLDGEICELKRLLDAKNEAMNQPMMLTSQPLSDDDKEVLYRFIRQFLKGDIKDPLETGMNTREKILESLFFLKEIIIQASKKRGSSIVSKPPLPQRSEGIVNFPDRVEANVSENVNIESKIKEKVQPLNDESNLRRKVSINTNTSTKDASLINAVGTLSIKDIVNKELSLNSILERRAQSFVKTSETSKDSRQTSPFIVPSPKPVSLPASPFAPSSISSSPSILSSTLTAPMVRNLPKNPITPETMAMSSHYISPFEQKRRAEIVKKIDSVSKTEDDMQKEKNLIIERQIAIEIQQNEEKLAMLSRTVENQKARIKYLTQVNTDPEQLENERIAKKRLETKAKQLVCRISELRTPNSNVVKLDDKLHAEPKEENFDITSKNTGLILQNLSNKERHQHKVKEGLEQIKIQQLEQELQIKEAATRRKLLALKQQLKCDSFSSNDIPRKTQSLPVSSQSDVRNLESNDTSNKLLLDPYSFRQHQHSTRAETYDDYSSNKNYRDTNSIENIVKQDNKFIPQPPAEIFRKSNNILRVTGSPNFTAPTSETKNIPVRENASKIAQNAPKTTENYSKGGISQNPMKIEEKSVNSQERAYMNAVQSNRTRVEKIRRVINAAQVIQRNWRKYKLRTK